MVLGPRFAAVVPQCHASTVIVVVMFVAAQHLISHFLNILEARHAARLKGVQHNGVIFTLHPETGMSQPFDLNRRHISHPFRVSQLYL